MKIQKELPCHDLVSLFFSEIKGSVFFFKASVFSKQLILINIDQQDVLDLGNPEIELIDFPAKVHNLKETLKLKIDL